mgnify:CR=1 FL=1
MARAGVPLASVQNGFSLVKPEPSAAVLPWCVDNGVGLLAYSPLFRGLLHGAWGPDKTFPADDSPSWVAFACGDVPSFDPRADELELRTKDRETQMKELLKLRRVPTAVVCSNDWTAIGALHAIHGAGLEVPRDISLVGFDDIPLGRYTTPSLTTVRMSALPVRSP